jgi:hypothetical protein
MPYCITLISRSDTRITGWYDGTDSRWSTDRNRQKVFDRKSDARLLCHELRSLCPRNAEVINIEAELNAPFVDVLPPMFSPSVECPSKEKLKAASAVEKSRKPPNSPPDRDHGRPGRDPPTARLQFASR